MVGCISNLKLEHALSAFAPQHQPTSTSAIQLCDRYDDGQNVNFYSLDYRSESDNSYGHDDRFGLDYMLNYDALARIMFTAT